MPQRPVKKSSDLSATAPSELPHSHKILWLVGGMVATISILVAAVAWAFLSGTSETSPPINVHATEGRIEKAKPVRFDGKTEKTEKRTQTNRVIQKSQAKVAAEGERPAKPATEPAPLWESPTGGRPLNLGYLSPGAQIIAVLRPTKLLEHLEAEKIRAALGPAGQHGIDAIEQATLAHLASIDQLIIGAQVTSAGNWLVTYVVHTEKPISRDALLAQLKGATEKANDGHTYWMSNDHAYYLPSTSDGKVLVVTPPDNISDIINLAGNPPPLRRDIERLLDHTDSDRQVTIIVAPNSLFSEGQSMFAGELQRLRHPLFWFLGDELSGAALSMNWSDQFFLELIATPKLETTPEKAANILTKRSREIPDKLQAYIVSLNAQPYGREIVSRFPTMLRKLAAYTRYGFEPDHAVLRCYLPVVAGHNLLMAAEIILAEPPGAEARIAFGNSSTPANSPSVQDRLKKVTSLRFLKDTLEAAIEQLSQDIGTPIVIRGSDLQADGITKNQSFGIDLANKPAEEILVQILRLANPDKEATGPADIRQKLVYVIERGRDKTDQIVVTTRAKAAERHDELPPAFRPAKP